MGICMQCTERIIITHFILIISSFTFLLSRLHVKKLFSSQTTMAINHQSRNLHILKFKYAMLPYFQIILHNNKHIALDIMGILAPFRYFNFNDDQRIDLSIKIYFHLCWWLIELARHIQEISPIEVVRKQIRWGINARVTLKTTKMADKQQLSLS